MIEINKQGNAIRIDFTDNDKYLFNGTMEVAPNELMLVVDESDMITFKRATNGDVLFSQIVDNIKISGSAVTKDNIIEQFATIGFISGGGSGEGAVTSVNGQTGDVVLTANSLDVYTKAEADTLYATKSDLNSKADISAVEALSTEVAANRTVTTALTSKVNEDSEKIASLDTEMDNKANSADVPTNTQFNSLAGEVANKADKTSVYTKQEADDKFATNTLVTELTDNVRTLQTDKQDKLVSGTTIKTVNGESILGNGNIEISPVIDTEMSDTSENAVQNKAIKQYVDTASSEFSNWKNGQSIVAGQNSNSTGAYAVTIGGETENTTAIGVVLGYGAKAKSGWPVIIGKDCIASNDTFAHNVLIDSMSTSGSNNVLIAGGTGFMSSGDNQVIINTLRGYETDCKYNDIVSINAAYVAKSNNQVNILATGGASDSVAIGLLSDNNTALRIGKDGKAYIYNNGTEVAIQDTINKVNTEITELISSKANSADVYTKEEIDSKGYLTEHQDISNLATKEELATKADASALSSKLDTLVSGTNIKTINGDSILGSGNLVIQSGASNWDDIQGKPLFAGVATSGDYNDLINKPTIPDISGLATKEEIADMETKSNAAATYATKLEIPSLEGYLTETVASETYATKLELGNKLDTATYNSEKAGFETKENAAATYQVKGDYATKSEIPTATSQLTNDSGFITEIPSEYITETELSSSLNSKADSANVYTKAEIDNMIGEISARLDQINGEAV